MNTVRALWTIGLAVMLATVPLGVLADQHGEEDGGSGASGEETDGADNASQNGTQGPGAQNGTQGTGAQQNGTPDESGFSEHRPADAPTFRQWCQDEHGREACQAECLRDRDGYADCFEAFCEEHGDARQCQYQRERAEVQQRRQGVDGMDCPRGPGRDCPAPLPPRYGAAPECASLFRANGGAAHLEAIRACCETLESRDTAARCDMVRNVTESLQKRDHIDFEVDPESNAVWDYTVDGRPLLDGAWYESEDPVVPVAERLPHALWLRFIGLEAEDNSTEMGDEAARLILHDNPTGLVSFRAEEGNITIDLPDNATIETVKEGEVYRVMLDGYRAHLVGDDLEVTGDLVTTDRFLAIHVLPARPAAAPTERGAVQDAFEDAMEKRHLGATISVEKRTAAMSADAEDDQDAPEVVLYDDMNVSLQTPADRATPADPLWVEVSAELTEGRTVVIDVDPEVLQGGTDLDLRYYDIAYDNGTRHQAQVLLVQADSLQDVMDPTDDGIQPEYWVVEDADGIHVLLSVPTWSTHALSIASIGEVVLQPSVMAGILAGVVGTAAAGYAMFRPRRS